METENTRVKYLRDKLENGLLKNIPNSKVNGDRTSRLPNTSNISFEFVEGKAYCSLWINSTFVHHQGLHAHPAPYSLPMFSAPWAFLLPWPTVL